MGEAEVYAVPRFSQPFCVYNLFKGCEWCMCESTPCTSYSQLHDDKLGLCQDMAEGYFGLCKPGSSSAEASVYPQTLHSICLYAWFQVLEAPYQNAKPRAGLMLVC